MKSKSEDLEFKFQSLEEEFWTSNRQSERELIAVKLGFLQALMKFTTENKSLALKTLDKYKEKYPEDNSQELLKFFIEYEVFYHFKDTTLPLNAKEKHMGHYIFHTLGCYANIATKLEGTFFMAALATSPLIIAAAIISGIIDSESRKPLDSTNLVELFTNLGRIIENADKKKIIQTILERYNDCEGFALSSTSSSELFRVLLPKSGLSFQKKWDLLLYYVTDIEKNNGKALFLIIEKAAKFYISEKFGFTKIHAFQSNDELPYDVKTIIKYRLLQLFQKEHEVEENIQSNPWLIK